MPKEYSSNKDYYNKNQTTIEYGTSKTFYPADKKTSAEEKEELSRKRMELRRKYIDYILDQKAKPFFKHFPFLVILNDENIFVWDKEKLELEDDINLTFKHTIVSKYIENNPEN